MRLSDLSQLLFQSRRKKIGGVIKRAVGAGVEMPSGVSGDDRVDGLGVEQVHGVCKAMDAVAG